MRRITRLDIVEDAVRPLFAYLGLFLIGAIICVLLALILDRMLGLNSGAIYWLWMITGIPPFVTRLWRADRKVMALIFIPLATAIAFLVPWVFRLITLTQLGSSGVPS